jgi:glycosyltransferase involved in cell wall biosynthesis
MMLWLEIGPLGQSEYAGIANVVCNLAERMLADRSIEIGFFIERRQVPIDLVAELVEMRSGTILGWLAANCNLAPVSVLSDAQSVGIFGNVKTAHFLFDYEAQIIHDISCLLTPEFHRPQTNQYHYERLLRDIATNDLNVCVSSSTKRDLERYFPEFAKDKGIVAHLGWAWPDRFAALFQEKVSGSRIAPYILVLGTIEPRKNIDAMFAYLAQHRALTERFTIVICGGHGWGPRIDEKINEFRIEREVERGRIVFTGFVGEFAKYCLLASSTLVVYPSLFEGFGLPVLEALSLGKAVITTASSSIPEVGGDAVFYFEPFESHSFGNALSRALDALAADPTGVEQKARARAELFSWQRFYTTIKDRILLDLSKQTRKLMGAGKRQPHE